MITALPDERMALLWAKVDKTSGDCWIWTAATTNGYGAAWDGTRVRMAHRLFYEQLVGDPGELVLDHLCRNRACVNPAHLEPTTHRTNILRGIGATARNAAKTHCPKGHAYADHAWIDTGGRRRCEVCRPEPATIHNQLLTHCKNGHEFNQENTYFAPWGKRICRICRNARRRTAYAEGRPT